MEPWLTNECIPNKSKKRVFSRTSFMDPEVIEIPHPHVRTPERKQEAIPDVIDLDNDEDVNEIIIMGKKDDARRKGKAAEVEFYGYGNYKAKEAVPKVFEAGESIEDSTCSTPGLHELGNLGSGSYDNSVDNHCDDFTNIDDYAMWQSYFDGANIPAGVETSVPWFPDSTQSKTTNSSASSAFHSGFPMMSDSLNVNDMDPYLSSWPSGPTYPDWNSYSSYGSFYAQSQMKSHHVNTNGMNPNLSLWSLDPTYQNWNPPFTYGSFSPAPVHACSHPVGENSSSPSSSSKSSKTRKFFASLLQRVVGSIQGKTKAISSSFPSSHSSSITSSFLSNHSSVKQSSSFLSNHSSVKQSSSFLNNHSSVNQSSSFPSNHSSVKQIDPMMPPPGAETYPTGHSSASAPSKQSSSVASSSDSLKEHLQKPHSPVKVPAMNSWKNNLNSLFPPALNMFVPQPDFVDIYGFVNPEKSIEYCLANDSARIQKRVDKEDILTKFHEFKQFDTVEDHSGHYYASSGSSVKQVGNNWAKKIQEEWKILEKNLPDTILVRVYEQRMDIMRAVIVGAEGTPYHDGLFFFDISFPSRYPNVPPKVYYHSGGLRLNPNLYNTGKVCLSLLNTWTGNMSENWIPGLSTMLQVLVSIQALILNQKPYFNEPGHELWSGMPHAELNSQRYSENTFTLSLKTMIYTMRRPPKHFEDYVIGHFYNHAHDILAACKAYMDGAPVGCIVKGGIQDVEAGGKICSSTFKASVAALIGRLAKEFAYIGVTDIDSYLPNTKTGNIQALEMPKAAM